MISLALWVAAVALLLFGLSIVLWQKAEKRAHQNVTSAFVDRQIFAASGRHGTAGMDVGLHHAFAPGPGPHAWRHFWRRAGLVPGHVLWLRLLLPALLLALPAAFFGGILSLAGALILYGALVYFRMWLRTARRHRKMAHQLPVFLDSMVRLSIIGNSLESAFQGALPLVEPPLREVLEHANHLIQAGVDLEPALVQEARLFRLPDLELIAAIIGVALRFGGRADTVLERMAAFMRDREQAQKEMQAMSAEIKLSAWILGLIPIGPGLFLIVFNNGMFMQMLEDPLGKQMLIGAILLEAIGAYWLYRLARSV